MNLPKDVFMLLSFVNTKLRDDFDSLDSFCATFDVDKQEIETKLKNIGYKYVQQENQFKA